MYTIKDKLKDVSTRDLLRVLNTNKEYVVFNYHVTNVGHIINAICTNNYDRYEKYLEDGYSYVLAFYDGEEEYIKEILIERLNKISQAWTVNCYYYSFEDHLKNYDLSNYNYQRLLKIEKDI